jgi:hypothetical protein
LDGARFGKRGVHQRIAPCLSVGNNATRFLNSIANNPFSFLFPCLRLNQPYTDTLLRYRRRAEGRTIIDQRAEGMALQSPTKCLHQIRFFISARAYPQVYPQTAIENLCCDSILRPYNGPNGSGRRHLFIAFVSPNAKVTFESCR